jgi:hypothetical protein
MDSQHSGVVYSLQLKISPTTGTMYKVFACLRSPGGEGIKQPLLIWGEILPTPEPFRNKRLVANSARLIVRRKNNSIMTKVRNTVCVGVSLFQPVIRRGDTQSTTLSTVIIS